jgi:hypothetical protein
VYEKHRGGVVMAKYSMEKPRRHKEVSEEAETRRSGLATLGFGRSWASD